MKTKAKALRRAEMYEILGISENTEDQLQTRELLGEMMISLKISSFCTVDSREQYKDELLKELTASEPHFCSAVLTAHANDADKCIKTLYSLARLVKKAWGRGSENKAPSAPASASASASASGPAQSDTPTPTDTTTSTTTSTSTIKTEDAATQFPEPSDPQINTKSGLASLSTITNSEATLQCPYPDPPSTPQTNTRYWIADTQIYFRDAAIHPTIMTYSVLLSDLLQDAAQQTAHILHSTWVDITGLKYGLFTAALSQGLEVSVYDLTKRDIWMRVEDTVHSYEYENTILREEGVMDNLEDAFLTIVEEAMEHAFVGELPLARSLGEYEAMYSFFMGH